MTKARQKTIAPEWSNLPDHVQNDFHNAGFGNWYQQANNEGRLTLMNNYLKMSEADLWKFVQGPADPDPNRAQAGRLEFVTRNVQELRDHLYRREDFANPEPTPIISRFRNERWDSREHTHENSLHLKNFEGWPENRIQAHIDQQGLVPPPDAWRERTRCSSPASSAAWTTPR